MHNVDLVRELVIGRSPQKVSNSQHYPEPDRICSLTFNDLSAYSKKKKPLEATM